MMEPREEELSPDDLLISRVVDGTSTAADWERLEFMASHDRGAWERLAAAIRIEAGLREEVEAALEAADDVELPLPAMPAPAAAGALPHKRRSWSGLGWAAACLVGAAWALTEACEPPSPRDAGIAASSPAEPALEEGPLEVRHVALDDRERSRELPRLVVGTRPAEKEGALEVFFVRCRLESEVVEQLYQMGQDDLGRPDTIPVTAGAGLAYESL